MKSRYLKNLAIGKRFKLKNKVYEVKEFVYNDKIDAEESCFECAFFRKDSCPCHILNDKIPRCIASLRKDKKHVVFIEVKEEK